MNLLIHKIDFIILSSTSPICTCQKQSFYCKNFIEAINLIETLVVYFREPLKFVSPKSAKGDHFKAIILKGGYKSVLTRFNKHALNIQHSFLAIIF